MRVQVLNTDYRHSERCHTFLQRCRHQQITVLDASKALGKDAVYASWQLGPNCMYVRPAPSYTAGRLLATNSAVLRTCIVLRKVWWSRGLSPTSCVVCVLQYSQLYKHLHGSTWEHMSTRCSVQFGTHPCSTVSN